MSSPTDLLPRPQASAAQLPVEAAALPLWCPWPCLTGFGRLGCDPGRFGGWSALADVGTHLGGHELAVFALGLELVGRGLSSFRAVVHGPVVGAQVVCSGLSIVWFCRCQEQI